MADNISVTRQINSVSAIQTVNSVVVSAPGPQGPAGTFVVDNIPTIYPIINISGSIGYNTSYIPASATYSSSAGISGSTSQTNFSTLTLSGSNVATQSYVNTQDILYYASAQSYANSGSLNAYGQASAFSVTTANSASSNAYNQASAFAITQSNSASLNAYNSASAFTVSQGYQTSNGSVAYSTNSGYSNYAINSGSLGGITSGSYAQLNSPTFIGTPLAPTAGSGTNNTQIATTAYVRGEISNLVASAPTTLDTLNELATALGNDPNFATTTASQIGLKANTTYVDSQDQSYYASAQAYTTSRGYVTSAGSVAYATNAGSAINATSAGSAVTSTSATYSAWLDGYPASAWALLSSPSFTGTPLAPTAASTNSSTQIATTAFVNTAVANQAVISASLGYYGAFSSSSTQALQTINVGQPITLNQNDGSNGISITNNLSGSASRITFQYPGVYNIQWSGQFQNSGTSLDHDVKVWLKYNGTDVPGSTGIVTIPKKHSGVNGGVLPSWNFIITVNAGDFYEFYWTANDTDVSLVYLSPNSVPGTQSVIVTAQLVTYIQSASTTPYASSAGYSSSFGGNLVGNTISSPSGSITTTSSIRTSGAITAADIVESTFTSSGVVVNNSSGLLNSSSSLAISLGGTGQIYGSALIGRSTLLADRVKASNNTTPEAVFYDSSATTPQYINLEPDTTYSFDGYIGIAKDGTLALPNARILYYNTGSNTITPQAISCFAVTRANTAVLGGIDITAANTTVNSGGTTNSGANFHWQFSGVIRTNSASGGRFTIAVSTAQTLGTAFTFKAGSYINVVKLGSGSAVNFGNWTA